VQGILQRPSVFASPVPLPAAARLRLVIALSGLAVMLSATLVGRSRGLWAPDELRYAQIVQRMDRLSDHFVPRLWNNIYTEKPPLYFWLVRACMPWTAGVHLSTLLVPIVLASCVLLWLTGHIVNRWYGSRAGITSVVVLCTLPLFLLLSSIGRMDMLLALFVTAATYSFYRGYVDDVAASRIWAFVWMGVGLLAKGPFGIVFPLTVSVTALVITKKWRRLLCRETCWGLAALLATLACWLGPALYVAGFSYIEALIGKQVYERAVAGLDHGEPAYFYLWVLPIIILPWFVFLFPALRMAWKRWHEQRADYDLWLMCWVTVPLVILSLVREKLPVYLLPAMPPIAALIGRYWSANLSNDAFTHRLQFRVGWLLAVAATLGVVALAASLLIVNQPSEAALTPLVDLLRAAQRGGITELLLEPQTLCLFGGVLVLLSVVGWISVRTSNRRRISWTFATLASVAPCCQLFLSIEIMPALDAAQSWRAVANALAAAQDSGEHVVTYGLRPFAAYYLSDDITWFRKQNSLAEYIQKNGCAWCATRPQEIDVIRRHCIVDQEPERTYPTPTGPVLLVHLRPLAVADRELH
jgi:4-amino-4-deoxy-L-arabinose transferase-like glycosyltransferase